MNTLTPRWTALAPVLLLSACVHSSRNATSPPPSVAVTEPSGTFELPPLPPGRYTLRFEHRAGGQSTREIDVPGTGEPLSLTMLATGRSPAP